MNTLEKIQEAAKSMPLAGVELNEVVENSEWVIIRFRDALNANLFYYRMLVSGIFKPDQQVQFLVNVGKSVGCTLAVAKE